MYSPPLPPRSIRPNIDRPNESRSRARAPCTYLLTCLRIVVSPPLRRSSFARTYGGGREEKIHITLERNIYIYICAYTRVSSPSVPKKETKANHHIERERRVSRFPRYAPFYFLFFNSLSLSFRLASERTSEQTMRGYEARTSYRSFCLTERIFIGGKKKKMNALCSINPL